jgi:hypothetical protein
MMRSPGLPPFHLTHANFAAASKGRNAAHWQPAGRFARRPRETGNEILMCGAASGSHEKAESGSLFKIGAISPPTPMSRRRTCRPARANVAGPVGPASSARLLK